MKNIHVLPTDNKYSRLYFNVNDKEFQICEIEKPSTILKPNRHIYITPDESIKEGDWFLANNGVHKCIRVDDNTSCPFITLNSKGEEIGHFKTWKTKIILTTDQDLIKDGVQSIDDEFLEWFVKNPSCEAVEVYKSGGHYDGAMEFYIDVFYSITIPKEERKKNFYCGDEVDYGDQCSEQCVQCVNATGVDYGYLPHEDPKPFKHEVKSIPKEEIIGKRLEKYSERFDNDKSPIGNPDTWGKRLVDETIEEAFDRINNSIDFTEFDFASFKLGVKWEQERNK